MISHLRQPLVSLRSFRVACIFQRLINRNRRIQDLRWQNLEDHMLLEKLYEQLDMPERLQRRNREMLTRLRDHLEKETLLAKEAAERTGTTPVL